MTGQLIRFEGSEYRVVRLLGKGKSAWSWLLENRQDRIVLKQMHDEPCSYYRFTDKYASEIAAYQKLKAMSIPVPELIGTDEEKRFLFKEYIHGPTATELIAEGRMNEKMLGQLMRMGEMASASGFNLDYFPANFVWSCHQLYYVDYELNLYDAQWNLENWGLYYWVNARGMKAFLQTGDAGHINRDVEKGIPVRTGFEKTVKRISEGDFLEFTKNELR